jgi:hypothetical protein
MLHKPINLSQTLNLDPETNIAYEETFRKYLDFIGDNPLVLGERIKFSNKPINKGDLCFSGLGGRGIIKKFDRDEWRPGVWQKVDLSSGEITENYLIWVLQQKPILDYLELFSQGSFISLIPKRKVIELKIPKPKRGAVYEINKTKYRDEYDILLSELSKCDKNDMFLSGSILIGSIAEGLAEGILLDKEIKNVEGKPLGVKIMELEKTDVSGAYIEALKEINRLRKKIHINRLRESKILKEDFLRAKDKLAYLIKEFGI